MARFLAPEAFRAATEDLSLLPFNLERTGTDQYLVANMVGDFIRLHQDPVGKGATTGAANLVRQQLDRAVEDSVIVWFNNAKSAVIEQPNHASFFDGSPEHRIRLQHAQPFWRGFRDPGTDDGFLETG